MSFSDRPALSGSQKLGCFLYGAVSVLVVAFCTILSGLRCEGVEPSKCTRAGIGDFLLFPGSAILAIVGGILLALYFMRDRD